MNRERQVQAVESYVQAMRTGEGSAARQAGRFLADNVVLSAGEEEVVGRADVEARITGQWPMTPVYLRAAWTTPLELGLSAAVRTAKQTVRGLSPAITFPAYAPPDWSIIWSTINWP